MTVLPLVLASNISVYRYGRRVYRMFRTSREELVKFSSQATGSCLWWKYEINQNKWKINKVLPNPSCRTF